MLKNQWQNELASAFKHLDQLFGFLELDLPKDKATNQALHSFPLRVPLSYAKRIQKGNLDDPLLKQILPLAAEMFPQPGYTHDPLLELEANRVPGLLHKYPHRILLTLTGACAIHCRYCFRRHFPYAKNSAATKQHWQAISDYLKTNPEINEVILSGGDPLSLTDDYLEKFCKYLLQEIPIKRLRFHTRLPVVLPSRIDDSFCQLLLDLIQTYNIQLIMVVHVNHPQEINEEVTIAMNRLRALKIHLLNQSVLLRGVNDTASVLIDLSERLFAAQILPYYLHLLDKVEGASHFDVPIETAQTLHKAMREYLPGFLVPRLVCEEPQQLSKTWVALS